MAFITTGQLAREAATITEGRVKLAKSLTPEKDLFLSHSHYDSDSVPGVISMLERHGASVYVDLGDKILSALNMQQRCERVKNTISQCQRLVVLFSQNTNTSRWIPWELGLADGLHTAKQIATLPISPISQEEEWGKQEYFGLYPQVRYVRLRNKQTAEYVVFDPEDGLYWPLSNWLRL